MHIHFNFQFLRDYVQPSQPPPCLTRNTMRRRRCKYSHRTSCTGWPIRSVTRLSWPGFGEFPALWATAVVTYWQNPISMSTQPICQSEWPPCARTTPIKIQCPCLSVCQALWSKCELGKSPSHTLSIHITCMENKGHSCTMQVPRPLNFFIYWLLEDVNFQTWISFEMSQKHFQFWFRFEMTQQLIKN